MRDAIQAALQRVRSRQQTLFALQCVVVGLIVGAAGGLAVGVIRQALDLDTSRAVGAAVMVAGPVLGLIVGLSLRRDWHGAAAAVDAHYGLKDRAVTALAFAGQPAPSELQTIQINEALGHLNTVKPEAVVPLGVPRAWPVALAGLVSAAVVLALGVSPPAAQAGPAPVPDHILAAAANTKGKIAEFQKAVSDTNQDAEDDKADDEKKFKELSEKLAQKVEEINQPGIDEKEALAKLSEMMAEVQALANQLNVAALDGQLSSLGSALAATTAFEGAGKALQEGKLEKAAKELEKVEEAKLTPKEAKALEEKLKQLAKQMGDAGQGGLSEAAAELAEAIKSGDKGRVGQAGKNLAKKINNAVKRKKQNDLLTALNEEFKDAKCQCQSNGGAKIKQPSKSDSPSSTWGRAISGNTEGEKTKLNGKRSDVQVTGTPGGEGDSEVETTATPEARQRAAREYREKFEKSRQKESDTVVEGEPIPIGHRQIVKKYFELIRPSNGDMTEKPVAPATPGMK
jgi:hypothetical protein